MTERHRKQPQVKTMERETSLREQLRVALSQYVSDTFIDINTVKGFVDNHKNWTKARETESKAMIELKTFNKNRICPEKNSEAFLNTIKNMFNPGRAETLELELEKDLSRVLQKTLNGLRPMQEFLDALEKLSVTSIHVFEPIMSDIDLRKVQEIISDCKKICPLLLLFKRDNQAFFRPLLQNLDTLQDLLDTYIININNICRQFKNSPLSPKNPEIDLNGNVSEEDIMKMLSHINKLQELRMDEAFRTVFLFQGEHFNFTKEFYLHKHQMDEFLTIVEGCAKELDNMKKGKEISGVVSSVLGVGGGVVSIVGLALIPVTLGASTILIATGAGIAGLSGATSVATVVADSKVNSRETGKASDAFEKFMKSMNNLQKCLSNITNINCIERVAEDPVVGGVRMGAKVVSVGKCVDTVVDVASAGAQIAKVGKTGALVASKALRGGVIGVNALFIGCDVLMIVLNSVDLHKGRKPESSKFIRARAALWRSEIKSWEKICETLEQGQKDSQEKLEILQTPFWVGCKSPFIKAAQMVNCWFTNLIKPQFI